MRLTGRSGRKGRDKEGLEEVYLTGTNECQVGGRNHIKPNDSEVM